MKMKFNLDQECILSGLHSQYHAWWCSGDFRSQGISRHGINPQSQNILSPAWEESSILLYVGHTVKGLEIHHRQKDRLSHSLSLMAVGLSVGYQPWPLDGWHHPFVIGCSKYRLGLPQSQSTVALCHQWKFSLFFIGYWQPPFTALTAGICLPLALCKWDCERVLQQGCWEFVS